MLFYFSRHVLPDVSHGWRQMCLLRDLNRVKRKREECDKNTVVDVDLPEVQKTLHDPVPDFIANEASWQNRVVADYFRNLVQEKAYHDDIHIAQQMLEATRQGVQCPNFHLRGHLQSEKTDSAPGAELITAMKDHRRANLMGPYNQDIREAEPLHCLDFSCV